MKISYENIRRHDTENGTPLLICLLIIAFGLFSFSQTASAAPPGNDDFANAAVINDTAGSYSGTNVEATLETGEPIHAGSFGSSCDNSVWWRWTASEASSARISTAGSDFDSVLAVYTGSAVNALTLIAENDDYVGYSDSSSRLTFPADPGITYYIVVGGFDPSDEGLIQLEFEVFPRPPVNDDFSAALPITSPLYVYSGTNIGASAETGEPDHEGYLSHSVWWKWQAPDSDDWQISTLGSDYDTILAVYTGTAVDSLTLIDSSDDCTYACPDTVSFTTTMGETYYIAVDGYSGPDGFDDDNFGLIQLHFTRPTSVTSTVADWQDTGIAIDAGSTVNITASGSWSWGESTGPDGTSGRPLKDELPVLVTGALFGELVGKIGSESFSIGSQKSFRAPESGRLYLAMNDSLGFYADNSGSLDISMQVLAGPGDVNHDGAMGLIDAILSLKVVTNSAISSEVFGDAAVGSTGQIGLGDSIFNLQRAAGLPFGFYDNKTMAGTWLMGETADAPELYFIADIAGNIQEHAMFNQGDDAGVYAVEEDGSFTLTFQASGTVEVAGTLTSQTTADVTSPTPGAMQKVSDLSAAQGNWSGTLTDTGSSSTRTIALTVDDQGFVSATSGTLDGSSALAGRLFIENGNAVGFFYTVPAEAAPWDQFVIFGDVAGSNSLSGAYSLNDGGDPVGTAVLTRIP